MSKGTLLKLAAKNWKLLLGGGIVAHAHANDQNVLKSSADLASAMLNIRQQEGETLVGATTREVVDTFTEEGTTDHLLDKLKSTGQKAGQAASDLSSASRSLASGVADGVSGAGSSLLGTLTGMFKGLTGGISGLLGGGGSGLNIGAALMLPLAWFAFGKFGWIGKVAALSMLMYGVSNLFKQPEASVRQVRSGGDGRDVISPSEQFDAIVRQQESAGGGEQYNVRAKVS